MSNLTNVISVKFDKEETNLYQYFTKEELDKTKKELTYIEKHHKEYKSYNNVSDLKESLLRDN